MANRNGNNGYGERSRREKVQEKEKEKEKDQNQNQLKIPNPDHSKPLDSRNYVDTAETVVLHLKGQTACKRFYEKDNQLKLKPKSEIEQDQKFDLTTTKIRNLLSLLNVIQQMVKEEQGDKIGDEEILGKIQYFKMRCAYEAGRDSSVKDFVKKSNLIAYIDQIGESKKNFEIFFHYVEALVAYHRYYGGKNN